MLCSCSHKTKNIAKHLLEVTLVTLVTLRVALLEVMVTKLYPDLLISGGPASLTSLSPGSAAPIRRDGAALPAARNLLRGSCHVKDRGNKRSCN